jgi:hypothetical protein
MAHQHHHHRHRLHHHLSATTGHDSSGWVESITALGEDAGATQLLADLEQAAAAGRAKAGGGAAAAHAPAEPAQVRAERRGPRAWRLLAARRCPALAGEPGTPAAARR